MSNVHTPERLENETMEQYRARRLQSTAAYKASQAMKVKASKHAFHLQPPIFIGKGKPNQPTQHHHRQFVK